MSASAGSCDTVPASPAGGVGEKGAIHRTPLVALLGNPNTGKSTIFNRLTGLRQRVANYPGITIEAHKGEAIVGGNLVEVVDLPGAYSLSATSPDERVVVDVLTGHAGHRKPDVIVCVLDATNLKRNLFLASQLAEFDLPMVLVLNQWDAATKRGLHLDVKLLEQELGVPVIPTVGTKGMGIAELKSAIAKALQSPRRMRRIQWPEEIVHAAARLRDEAAQYGDVLSFAEACRLLFDANSALRVRLHIPAERLRELIEQGRADIRSLGLNPGPAEAVLQYAHLGQILSHIQPYPSAGVANETDHRIDALLVHRFWGSLIFLAVMWLIFQSVYAWASPLMDGIELLTSWAQEHTSALLEGTPVFRSLVVDGVIAGVGSVLVFLPQIFILFFFIAVLEDSGYLARAAFLMDKLFGWCGLNGKSFVPLLSSYACAIPGVLAAKTLEDPKARLATILMAPFMSCSARLPVYVLLIGAFIEPAYGSLVAGWTLFAMHFVGLAVSLPIIWFLNRVVLKTAHQPFLLELTSYRWPVVRNVLLRMWLGGKEFIVRAGTIIFAFSVIIWALLYFPRSAVVAERVEAEFFQREAAAMQIPEFQIREQIANDPGSELAASLEHELEAAWLEDSYLGRFGKFVQPVFAPAGFDWKITVGVLASFPAREVIIATLGIIYRLGPEVDEESEGLRVRMANERWHNGPLDGQPVFTIPVVFGLMVFFALCMQCGSTLAIIARQLNWAWAIGQFFAMTFLAWLAAVLVYQLGSRL